MIEAVEERHDGGVRADRGGEIVQGRGQARRLHREQDQAERAGQIRRGDHLGLDDVVAAGAGHAQAVLAERGGPGRAHQERDIAPVPGQERPEEAAGRPGADDQDVVAA